MRRFFLVLLSGLIISSMLLSVSSASAQDPCPTENSPNCKFGLPAGQYDALLKQMQANPEPAVSTIDVDQQQVNSFTFFKMLSGSDRFDGPNGSVIGKVGDGFNFVSIYKLQDGFAMLKDKTWLQMSSLKKTYASAFSGILVDKPLQYPMAWVVQSSIPSQIPAGVQSKATPAIKRYTRVNIYATVNKGGWDWYLVGPGQWLEQRKVARVDASILPTAAPITLKKWVAVDLYEQVLRVYTQDKLVAATLISSGLSQWQTRIGTFTVWHREDLTPMSGAMGAPDEYSLPAVPYVMYFDKDISLHGTYWHDGFGFKHSHGCVNMSISDAHWLYDWSGTDDLTVVVWNSHQN